MNEPFVITISYLETEHEFKARFERWGYTHSITVLVDEITFTFEPDEESGYRVMASADTGNANMLLLQAIAEKLAKLSL